MSITNGIVSSKIYDTRDNFNFDLTFPFLDWDVPSSPSYGVYISQLIRIARVCSDVDDFKYRNKCLTSKLFKQGYWYHKIRKAFPKFYYRHSELIVKSNICLKTLLQKGISEPVLYGDLVYKFKRIVGKPSLSGQFEKIIKRHKRVRYNIDIMCQSANLAVNPIMISSLIARRWVRPQTQRWPWHKASIRWLVPDGCLWLGPPQFILRFSLALSICESWALFFVCVIVC